MPTDPSAMDTDRSVVTRSDRRRRSVRQLLFVVAGSHTGAFVGSTVPSFGLPGDAFSLLLVGVLFALPFVVDAKWATVEAAWERLTGSE